MRRLHSRAREVLVATAVSAPAIITTATVAFASTPFALCPPAPAPAQLTPAQVEAFARDGYLVVENAIPPQQLSHLAAAVRRAARARGARYVPQSDKQHRPNAVQFEATLHEAMPADQRHRLGPNGQHEATFERREKRIKIQCRNRKEMERAYKKIVAMRQQYSTYKGVDLAPKAPGSLARADAAPGEAHLKAPTAAQQAGYAEKQRKLVEAEQQQGEGSNAQGQHGAYSSPPSASSTATTAATPASRPNSSCQAQQQQEFVKVRPQSRAETNASGFSVNADDDVDVHAFDKARARESFDKYRGSGQMETDIRKGSNLDDAFAYVYNGAQSWMHVWAGDAALRDAVFSRRTGPLPPLLTTSSSSSSSSTSSAAVGEGFSADASVAAVVGAISAQLCGVMTARLYTDTIIQRTPFCNATPFHHDSSGVNYRDPRGLHATIVLPGAAQPLDSDHGGYFVLPGSHTAVADITNDGRDMTGFLRPAAWDTGEALRAFPQLLRISPRAIGLLPPGALLFMSNMLVYGNGPNLCVRASEEGRRRLFSADYKAAIAQQGRPQAEADGPAPRAELFLDDEAPLTYSLSVMPDGVAFDGVRNTWMSKDTNGPLSKFEAGQPLRDPALFPVLYTEIPDTL